MSEQDRASLLRRFDEDWRAFWQRIDALDARDLRRIPDGSEWPVGMILAHCARWEDWTHDTIAAHVERQSIPLMDDLEEWNDRWAAEDRNVTPEDARRWLAEAHERLRSLIDSLRADQWGEMVLRSVESCTFEQLREHIESLPDWASGTPM